MNKLTLIHKIEIFLIYWNQAKNNFSKMINNLEINNPKILKNVKKLDIDYLIYKNFKFKNLDSINKICDDFIIELKIKENPNIKKFIHSIYLLDKSVNSDCIENGLNPYYVIITRSNIQFKEYVEVFIEKLISDFYLSIKDIKII